VKILLEKRRGYDTSDLPAIHRGSTTVPGKNKTDKKASQGVASKSGRALDKQTAGTAGERLNQADRNLILRGKDNS
jgi:hypothetical protein